MAAVAEKTVIRGSLQSAYFDFLGISEYATSIGHIGTYGR
jgi:hypothetical protein